MSHVWVSNLGHNLQHMAPFGIPTTGFCMVFQYATLVFSTLGTVLGTPDIKFGSRLGRGPFGHTNGPRKNMTLWKKWSPMRFHGDLCQGIGLYGAQEAFGQGHFPQTLPDNNFLDFPGFRDQFGGPPGPPWCLPIAPLWANGPILPCLGSPLLS